MEKSQLDSNILSRSRNVRKRRMVTEFRFFSSGLTSFKTNRQVNFITHSNTTLYVICWRAWQINKLEDNLLRSYISIAYYVSIAADCFYYALGKFTQLILIIMIETKSSTGNVLLHFMQGVFSRINKIQHRSIFET